MSFLVQLSMLLIRVSCFMLAEVRILSYTFGLLYSLSLFPVFYDPDCGKTDISPMLNNAKFIFVLQEIHPKLQTMLYLPLDMAHYLAKITGLSRTHGQLIGVTMVMYSCHAKTTTVVLQQLPHMLLFNKIFTFFSDVLLSFNDLTQFHLSF